MFACTLNEFWVTEFFFNADWNEVAVNKDITFMYCPVQIIYSGAYRQTLE